MVVIDMDRLWDRDHVAPYRPRCVISREGRRMSIEEKEMFLEEANQRWQARHPGGKEVLPRSTPRVKRRFEAWYGEVIFFLTCVFLEMFFFFDRILAEFFTSLSYGSFLNGCDSREHSFACRSDPQFVPRVEFDLGGRGTASPRSFLEKMERGPVVSPLAARVVRYVVPRGGFFGNQATYRVRFIYPPTRLLNHITLVVEAWV